MPNLNYAGQGRTNQRINRVERGDPLGNSSVSRGETSFYGNESLRVVGSAIVSGWLIITGGLKLVGKLLMEGVTTMTGTFTAIGKIIMQGDVDITGPNTRVTGPFHVTGDQDNTGKLDIGGETTLRKNLNVVSGGKVVAGELTMDPTLGANGGLSAASRIHLEAPVTNITGNAIVNGEERIDGKLTAMAAVDVRGAFTNSGRLGTTSAANAYLDASNVLCKTTSAARFKIDPVPMHLADSILDVPVEWWIDLGNAERLASTFALPRPFTEAQQLSFDGVDLRRVPGVIAEKVKDAGGDAFVTYGPDGVIEGVAYDRLALARTQILLTRLDEGLERIAELEALAQPANAAA